MKSASSDPSSDKRSDDDDDAEEEKVHLLPQYNRIVQSVGKSSGPWAGKFGYDCHNPNRCKTFCLLERCAP